MDETKKRLEGIAGFKDFGYSIDFLEWLDKIDTKIAIDNEVDILNFFKSKWPHLELFPQKYLKQKKARLKADEQKEVTSRQAHG